MTRHILIIATLFVFALSACQPIKPMLIKPQAVDDSAARTAELSGDYQQAANLYLQLATTAPETQKSVLYLQAAKLLWQLEDRAQLQHVLASINATQLSVSDQIDLSILKSRIALTDNQPESALAELGKIKLDACSTSQQQEALSLKIRAYGITENWLEKANNHIALAKLLAAEQKAENQQALWQALMMLSPQVLDLFNPGIPPAVDSGWFALAYAVKAYQANPEALIVAIEDWLRTYPNHPADPAFYQKALSSGTRLPKQISDIVILLPTAGPYAVAAEAIKRGLIAAHYASQSSSQLHFLDVSTETKTGQSNVWQRYQQAVDMQASMVIGPLDKKAVEVLLNADSLPVPVLALNQLEPNTSKANLFQFGLTPEDDASAVARYAMSQGYQRTVILLPTGEWGDRIGNGFRAAWQQQGGTLLNSARYDESASDFANVITPLFSLDDSEQRYRSLKSVIGRSIEFEPRRRQDIDYLFVAGQPLKVRQIVPQLRFHRSGQLPIISTSHSYGGEPNAQQDIDLNGLLLPAVPWVFNELADNDPVYQAIHSNMSSLGNLTRLYAMGADAYRLVEQLNTLSRSQQSHFVGATGTLSIDEYGHIEREMPWGTFKQGLLQLISTQ